MFTPMCSRVGNSGVYPPADIRKSWLTTDYHPGDALVFTTRLSTGRCQTGRTGSGCLLTLAVSRSRRRGHGRARRLSSS